MLEVIIYFVMAAVVCAMLYMVLGKQVGEPPETPLGFPEPGAPKEQAEPRNERRSKHYDGDAGDGLSAIANADNGFDPDMFIDNAKAAYGMILEAYADGDKETLEMLLAADMNEAYVAAIEAREVRGVTQTTDLARIISANYIDASADGKTASITVEYDAEIASAIINSEGETVEGDLDRLARVSELWTYNRNLGSKNPNWLLVSVEEAGEDTLGSAPDFKSDKD